MQTQEKVAIAVALIGLVGAIGAAIISSDRDFFGGPAEPVANGTDPNADPPVPKPASKPTYGPHAPPIQANQSTLVWGEQTRLIDLLPGDKVEIDARNLYSEATTYPQSSCAGPGYIIYTWRVRHPYPEGGDLEIRGVIPQGGGNTEQVAMGAMGRGIMSPCNIHIFINRGLEPIKLELRYATAIDEEPLAELRRQEEAEQ